MRVTKYLTLALAAGFVACEGGAGPQMSHVSVLLTDAPGPSLDSAVVWISQVYLVGSDGTSRYTIASGFGSEPDSAFNLLQLQGGVTALIGDKLIPAGDYEQLRMIVDSAWVRLASGNFSNGTDTATMKVPSGPQTGIKVEFAGPVHIAPGQTVLVVDFDVSRSFVFLGPPSGPFGVLFKPVLHGAVQDVAGSISGTSSPAPALGRVFAINGTDTVGAADADPSTGAYTIRFLPPATYTVVDSSTANGHKAPTQSIVVGPSEDVKDVNFTIP